MIQLHSLIKQKRDITENTANNLYFIYDQYTLQQIC